MKTSDEHVKSQLKYFKEKNFGIDGFLMKHLSGEDLKENLTNPRILKEINKEIDRPRTGHVIAYTNESYHGMEVPVNPNKHRALHGHDFLSVKQNPKFGKLIDKYGGRTVFEVVDRHAREDGGSPRKFQLEGERIVSEEKRKRSKGWWF